MKKNLVMACVLAGTMMLMVGCSGSNTDTSANTAAEETAEDADAQETEDTDEAEDADAAEETTGSKTITPLATGFDPTDLSDCIVPVSFEKSDFAKNSAGEVQLAMTVYAYDSFDMVDISTMQVGDHITICQEDVEITSLEQDEYGAYIINGGIEEGGYQLRTDEDTTFYPVSWDDAKIYYEVAAMTLPVADDFSFADSSDLTEKTYTADDILNDNGEMYDNFVPNSTSVHIQNSTVVGMERVYMP